MKRIAMLQTLHDLGRIARGDSILTLATLYLPGIFDYGVLAERTPGQGRLHNYQLTSALSFARAGLYVSPEPE